MTEITGHCLCGACGFAYSGVPRWQGYCHCDSCRRATGSPVTAYIGVPKEQWRWTGQTPRDFQSSPGVRWWFCQTCGSPLAYIADRYDGEAHFFAALLDHPEAFRPQAHFHFDEHLGWLDIADDLPRHGATGG